MTPDQLTDLITPIIAAHVQVVTDPHLARSVVAGKCHADTAAPNATKNTKPPSSPT